MTLLLDKFFSGNLTLFRYFGETSMELATKLAELQKRTIEHREVLLTEEAAKNALVMPFSRLSP